MLPASCALAIIVAQVRLQSTSFRLTNARIHTIYFCPFYEDVSTQSTFIQISLCCCLSRPAAPARASPSPPLWERRWAFAEINIHAITYICSIENRCASATLPTQPRSIDSTQGFTDYLQFPRKHIIAIGTMKPVKGNEQLAAASKQRHLLQHPRDALEQAKVSSTRQIIYIEISFLTHQNLTRVAPNLIMTHWQNTHRFVRVY